MAFDSKFKNPNLANNIANTLTASRIVLSPVFALCVLYMDKYPSLSFWLVVTVTVMVLTDCFDGVIAKKWGVPSALGSFLDPLADKIAIDVAFVVICIKYGFPIWATIIVVSRDVFVLGAWCFFLLVLEESFRVVPHLFGKLMVSSQALTIIFALLRLPTELIRWAWRVTIFFSIASLIIYAVNLKKYRKAVE